MPLRTAAGPVRPAGLEPRPIALLSRGLQLKSIQLHGGWGVGGSGWGGGARLHVLWARTSPDEASTPEPQ